MKKVLSMLMCMLFLTTAALSTASAKDVFVTKKGKKYHAEQCRWTKNRETTKLSDEDAVEKNYKPCGRCMKEDK